MAKDNVTWQPKWVPLPILDFARIVHNFADNKDALAQWIKTFADDLLFCNLDSTDEFTIELLSAANEKYTSRATACKKAGKASAKARKQKQKSQEVAGSGNAPDASGNGLEEFNDQETATGNYQVPDKVSTNNGDAARREAADGEPDGNVAADRTTVSNPLALDMPGPNKDKVTAKTRDSRGSGRYQPPSLGPEDGTNAAQPDNPANDQSDRHKRGREEPATDADIRKDSENMPDAGNGGTLESGTSAAGDSFGEARESRTGAGAPPVRSVCHDAPAPYGRRVKPPKNSAEVMAFAADHEIDEVDARDWYELNFVIRPGCDKDGCVIENWPGHLIAYCRTVKEKRESA